MLFICVIISLLFLSENDTQDTKKLRSMTRFGDKTY